MHRNAGLVVLFALVALFIISSPAQASGAICSANPVAGPPGTAFTITCTGFSANTIVNTYVVEPDGRAISGSQIFGFTSNIGNGSILTDKSGTATFTWQSAGGGAAGFADQIGSWTWVVHELAPGGGVAAEGHAQVQISSQSANYAGAVLVVSPTAGTTFNFAGTGFAPFETANIWVTLPGDCSGRANVEGASADEPFFQGFYDGFSGPNSVKADSSGNIAFSLVFASNACRGFYTVTARALGSGVGGTVSFEVTGNSVSTNALLSATPNSVTAIAPFLTLLGSGYPPSTKVNCWTTRPDGRVFQVGTASVDSSGNFALSVHASGFDSLWPFASEEPGVWYATCAPPNGSFVATTSFMVTSLTSDP